tara:strand:+ start:2471 stop:3982 length:1512 start_codon:yes stop_codon:yes gene_type:complete
MPPKRLVRHSAGCRGVARAIAVVLVVSAVLVVLPVPGHAGESASIEKAKALFKNQADLSNVIGKVSIATDGQALFTPDASPAVTLKVLNWGDSKATPQGLPLQFDQVSLSKDGTAIKYGQANLSAYGIFTKNWDSFTANAAFAPVTRQIFDLNKAVRGLVAGDVGATEAIKAKLPTALEETAKLLTTASLSPMQAEPVFKMFDSLRTTGKAVFAREDIYRPTTYRKIFENSRGAAGIVRRDDNGAPGCSGFLVGSDLLMTARHCVGNYEVSDLTVWFDYEELDANHTMNTVAVPVAEIEFLGTTFRIGSPDMDFALLRLSKHVTDANRPRLCLGAKRAYRDDPIYVVGHPNYRRRQVHDNAFIYYPFEVSEKDIVLLRAVVKSEYRNHPDQEVVLKDFEESYVKFAPEKVYRNYSKRWRGQPTIGADSDTYKGNSGSPVFDRRSHLVIGILFDGQQDHTQSFTVDWQTHEAILPTSEIIRQLNAKKPDWAQGHDVCIDGKPFP